MDMDAVLKAGLKTATGASVYALGKPVDAPLPTLVYRRISDRVQDSNHQGGGSLHIVRVQITHVASSYAGLRTLVTQVQNYLEGNKTDFSASLATDIHIEDKEADDIFVAQKDYFVQYKA